MNELQKLGFLYVVSIPILAGLSMFPYDINGFNYTGYIWVGQLVVGIFLLASIFLLRLGREGTAPWRPWLIWYGLLWVSLLWCQEVGRRNFQEVVQHSMPLVVGLVAAWAIHTREALNRLLNVFLVTFACVAIFTLFYVASMADIPWFVTPEGYSIRATAMATTLVGGVFLARCPQRVVLPILGWVACLMLTTLTSSRTATFALLMVPVVHPLYRTKLWNVTAVAATAILGLALFHTPMFQDHFFASGAGSLEDLSSDDFMDSGRFGAWGPVWDKAWEHPILGAGVGSAFDYVPHIWENEHNISNDYLRIGFEVGVLGLALFAVVIGCQFFDLYRRIQTSDGVVRSALAAAWVGLVMLLASSFFENTITYHIYFTNPLFAILGGAYGVLWAEREHAQATVDVGWLPIA